MLENNDDFDDGHDNDDVDDDDNDDGDDGDDDVDRIPRIYWSDFQVVVNFRNTHPWKGRKNALPLEPISKAELRSLRSFVGFLVS